MSLSSENKDRLSSLPEDVVLHILSLMPTCFAVRTSTLSKRWRYSWTSVTNLDFNLYHCHYHYHRHGCHLNCFSKFGDWVLKHCKTSQVKSFQLGLIRDSVRDVSKWINEAIIRLNVCELDILVRPTELPLSLFTCKSLTKLKLAVSFDDFHDFNDSPPVIMLPALKTLDLRVYSRPSLNLFRLIHGCPVLESLSLHLWPDNEENYNFNIPTLQRLEFKTGCLVSSKVVLNVPNLEYLFVGGELCSHFVMEDFLSLVEATVSFSYSDVRFNHLNAELLKGISGAKSLSWSTPSLGVFWDSPLPKFPNLKHLDSKGSLCSRWLLVIQILEYTPELERLCFEEPEDNSWIEPLSVPACMLTNLKTMKITKCKGRKCDMQFLEYILGHAEALKMVTIVCGSLNMKDELEMCTQLLKFPRASRFCEIHFVGKWLNSIGN